MERAEAKARGCTRYFSGIPCRNGHVAERLVSNLSCVLCLRVTGKQAKKKYRVSTKHRLSALRKTDLREKARRGGLSKYFTGKPCPKGHISQRYVCDGKCVECVKVRDRLRELTKPPAPPRFRPRQAALESGQSRYFNGIPCPEGHVSERYTYNGRCLECQRTHTKALRNRRLEADNEFAESHRAKCRRRKNEKRNTITAAKTLTEITGIPHEAVETVDANGKKTWQPRPVADV